MKDKKYESPKIGLNHEDIFNDFYDLLIDENFEIKEKYQYLYLILTTILRYETSSYNLEFSGPFAMLDFICNKFDYIKKNKSGYTAIQKFRAKTSKQERLEESNDDELKVDFPFHVKAVIDFFCFIYNIPTPQKFDSLLPENYISTDNKIRLKSSVRVIVSDTDENYIYAIPDEEYADNLKIALSYVRDKDPINFTYLLDYIKKGSQLNLIRPILQGQEVLAELIILEPDFLVDVTSIASCFDSCGTTPLNYLVNKISPKGNTASILLGNFASQMLDEAIYNYDGTTPEYKKSAIEFFQNNALSLSACKDEKMTNFHNDAKLQRENINEIVHKGFAEDKNIEINKLILEPSFFSEILGLQGRLDLMQIDKKVLVEQKSGKKDEYKNQHKTSHYVQMLLYLAFLHYGQGKANNSISCYLLYSKYRDGLIVETAAPKLLRDAFKIRNEIINYEFALSCGQARNIYENLEPEDLNTNGTQNRLWTEWVQPRLSRILDPLHNADDLIKDYFYRFFSFIAREHLLAKIGTCERESSGFSALWNSTLSEKKEAGNILCGLTLRIENVREDGGVDEVILSIPQTDDVYLPNFRKGDIVVFYSYRFDSTPDVCRDMVFRCTIIEIKSNEVKLKLRNPQKNRIVFDTGEKYLWAMEPDFIESSFAALYRGMQSFVSALPDVQDLLLNKSKPQIDVTINNLNGDYGEFNELVLKAKRAKDYFLLVGPPGTGKTSVGLVNILKETLTEENSNVLLLAYTNRAVDEICSKLIQHNLDFIRIGTNHSCSEIYKNNLLCCKCNTCNNVTEIKNLILNTRIFVGTTTALVSNDLLFNLKSFSLAIVDEASQILEPHIIGLLCARKDNKRAIEKFVFIGDHKQLPAVVQQSKEESFVKEESLINIGLTNCANSIFERLISINYGNEDIIHLLTKQARMHCDVANFPNKEFYNSNLETRFERQCIPNFLETKELKGYKHIISTKRFSFFNVSNVEFSLSNKVNLSEAKTIAYISKAIYELYEENNKEFDENKSLGIIVPYRHQIAIIKRELELFQIDKLLKITIDTIERYQGSERDFIIYGFTIKKETQLNFLTNNVIREYNTLIDRKLNVALTRARETMIVVGNEELLKLNITFSNLVNYAKSNKCFYKTEDIL